MTERDALVMALFRRATWPVRTAELAGHSPSDPNHVARNGFLAKLVFAYLHQEPGLSPKKLPLNRHGRLWFLTRLR